MKDVPSFAYQAVYLYLNRLIDNVQSGTSTKLPSLRHLAGRLKVSVSTVQYAYCLLEKEGRVCSIPKSGYFTLAGVDRQIPDEGGDLLETLYANARRPGMFVLSHDDPTVLASLESPLLMLERELIRHYPRRAYSVFQPFGELELRTALADRYTTCAVHGWCSDNVYVGADLSGVLKIVLDVLALRGGTVLVESPCSWTILRVLKSFNIRVIEVPLDAQSCVDLACFQALLSKENIGLALLPSCVSPIIGPAAVENRRQLAGLLNQHGVWVLENDSHGELCFEQSANRLRDWVNPHRLMVFSAFDKIIGPEAPYGYVLCKHLRTELQQHFLVRSFRLSPIRQKAIARLYSTGRIDLHVIGLRRLLEDRMLMMATLLNERVGDSLRFNLPAGGAGIWAECIQPVNMRQVFDRLLKQRISIAPGEVFSLQGLHQQNLRISFAFDWTQDIGRALEVLDRALRQERL
ncbi:PLP-dependent aminotransferase family protein [Pseudomonas sp. CCI3.2]|uniref:aminotransferase-like domain-containing protein n=1 Tax=unclassified Pseudomonas TaxID=196821 RepID=UPI002AC9EEAD|nr:MULTISPECIES: PLP-dependent aminotransferase family protein [unclassified Pseudomonas]MEB0076131.1 PLP-dependent aminotransferase family protein [Pseudomonas sp. MH10out]MEB0092911.1 PLP-dependent aminotransferase family protein [Pseudomonas sp. CCI4.2]MEB0100069.1 PLP-dependent aminotransferase family protein [Pseudomonas sp. CCI3.2]MEB0132086.1 PLP-dependent aminotransferase family protein [Pseudomonas sp. CCI2.4]MEB0156116.1 PLP-dependent aminotransferase family protein [Pseudomonas sp. 